MGDQGRARDNDGINKRSLDLNEVRRSQGPKEGPGTQQMLNNASQALPGKLPTLQKVALVKRVSHQSENRLCKGLLLVSL